MAAENLLWAKADGTVRGILAMPDEKRVSKAHRRFAEDYNRLRDLVEAQKQGLKDLLPPKIEFGENRKEALAGNCEILTYCEQIKRLLENPPTGGNIPTR